MKVERHTLDNKFSWSWNAQQSGLSNAVRKALTPRTIYANRKGLREATSLQMMMHMNAKKVKSIQGQFEAAGEYEVDDDGQKEA